MIGNFKNRLIDLAVKPYKEFEGTTTYPHSIGLTTGDYYAFAAVILLGINKDPSKTFAVAPSLHACAVSEQLIEYKMHIAHAVARHCMSKHLCLVRRIHNGPPRKGILKYVDLAENRDGSVGGGFLTSLLRMAKNSREVREIVNEATRRFEGTPWQLLSAAARVSAGPSVDDPQLAGTLLASISPKDIPYIREGVLRAVLGNASRHKNGALALNAFRLLMA